MSIFGNSTNFGSNMTIGGDDVISESLQRRAVEMFIVDEVAHLDENSIQEFCHSEVADSLMEAGLLRKNTIVRLSKTDDISRRKTMAAFAIAREKNDKLWRELVKNRVKERKLIGQIVAKYGSKADKVAKLGQRDYMKNKFKLPNSFMRAGGNDRISK